MTKNSEAIFIRLPAELLEQAKKLAEEQDRPVAYIIRQLLREKIAKESEKKQKQVTK